MQPPDMCGSPASKTSLIEARLIVGDDDLFKKFQKALISKCVEGHEEEYINLRLEDQAERRTKFGNSACMQEPNIKNGCGGLRDFQNLLWMAFFKYRTRSLAELQKRELISESEGKQLEAAYNFLLQVRNDLHYHVNRPADVLSKSIQPTIAHNLGYSDRSPVKRLEAFMGDLYSHMRNIYLITRTLEQRLALLPHPERRLPSFGELLRQGRHRFQQQLVDGFKCIDGEICPVSGRVFRDQPRRLMRVFLYAQQRGQKLQAHLAQMIRNQLSLVDRAFLRDQHVRETFLEILNQRGNVAPILRAMLADKCTSFFRISDWKFCRQKIDFVRCFACLDFVVFFPRIALLRYLEKWCIDQLIRARHVALLRFYSWKSASRLVINSASFSRSK